MAIAFYAGARCFASVLKDEILRIVSRCLFSYLANGDHIGHIAIFPVRSDKITGFAREDCVTKPARFHHIDAIRAIAALLVMTLHFADIHKVSEYTKTHGEWLWDAAITVDIGRIGVMIFFGVSGFVIPSSLANGQSTKNFLIRRFFRLYPAYWLSIFAAIYVEYYLYNRSLTAFDVFANITMTTKLFDKPYIQGLYWTLTTEMIFYFICIMLNYAKLLHNQTIISAFSLFFAIIYWYHVNYFLGPFWSIRADGILLGDSEVIMYINALSIMFLGASLRAIYDKQSNNVAIASTLAVCAIYIVLFPVFGLLTYPTTPAKLNTIQVYASCSMAIALFLILSMKFKINWKPLVKIGEASYSLYLFHPIVLWALVWFLVYHWPTAEINTVLLCIFMMLIAIPLAFLIYKTVELPAIEFGKRLGLNARSRNREISAKNLDH